MILPLLYLQSSISVEDTEIYLTIYTDRGRADWHTCSFFFLLIFLCMITYVKIQECMSHRIHNGVKRRLSEDRFLKPTCEIWACNSGCQACVHVPLFAELFLLVMIHNFSELINNGVILFHKHILGISAYPFQTYCFRVSRQQSSVFDTKYTYTPLEAGLRLGWIYEAAFSRHYPQESYLPYNYQ